MKNNIDNFYLCKEDWGGIQIEIKDGCLEIFEHIFSGPMEKEIWYKFDKENTEMLVQLLTENESKIEKTLKEKYSGLEGFNRLIDFCKDSGIKYNYNSYSSMDSDFR